MSLGGVINGLNEEIYTAKSEKGVDCVSITRSENIISKQWCCAADLEKQTQMYSRRQQIYIMW